jgi:hypothetical protein
VYLRNIYSQGSGSGGRGGGLTIGEDETPLTIIDEASAFLQFLYGKGVGITIYDGTLVVTQTVSIQVGDELNGKTVKVLYSVDGKIRLVSVVVENGIITLKTDGVLGWFLVVENDYKIMVNYSNPFFDVEKSDWFYYEAMWMYVMGIIKGVAQDEFAPNVLITREMFVTMLYRLEGSPEVQGSEVFSDIKTGSWYYDAVNWAAQNGIVLGVGDNVFGLGTLTGEQMVTMLYRFALYKQMDTSLTEQVEPNADTDDISKVSAWALPAFTWAVSKGFVNWRTNVSLNPTAGATRAQSAVVLQHFAEIYGPKVIVIEKNLINEQTLEELETV